MIKRITIDQRLEAAMADSAEHYRAGVEIMADLIRLLEADNKRTFDWGMEAMLKIKQARIWIDD